MAGVYSAIIFDCFGVLATDGWLPFKRHYFGNNTRNFEKASELNRQSDAGLISVVDFTREIASMAGVSEAEVLESTGHNVPNEELFEYIRFVLKPEFKLGLLSNTSSNVLEQIFTHQQIELFDALVLSFESGITKPDPRAYRKIMNELSVEPEQCIFVDDQERHCTGAREVGMQTIWYKDFPQFCEKLDELFADSKY